MCVREPALPTLGALGDPLQGQGPAELGGRCDTRHHSGAGSLMFAGEKERRSRKDFECVYFAGALFLDFSYSGLELHFSEVSRDAEFACLMEAGCSASLLRDPGGPSMAPASCLLLSPRC